MGWTLTLQRIHDRGCYFTNINQLRNQIDGLGFCPSAAEHIVHIGLKYKVKGDHFLEVGLEGVDLVGDPVAKHFRGIRLAKGHTNVDKEFCGAKRIDLGVPVSWV